MKLISKLYLATLGKVSSTPQPIVRELVASERGLENLFFGKRKGKILVSFMAPLTSNLAQTSKEEVVLVLHQRLVLPGGH